MVNRLFDQTIEFIQRALDIFTIRQKIISNNISNFSTPNYFPKEIPFQKILENSIEASSVIPVKKSHLRHLDAEVGMSIELTHIEDKFSLDKEMSKLAQNQLMFQSGVQALLKKLEALKLAIQEGGK
jgi:flagellar basal-body rod protein FlgB